MQLLPLSSLLLALAAAAAAATTGRMPGTCSPSQLQTLSETLLEARRLASHAAEVSLLGRPEAYPPPRRRPPAPPR